MRTITCTYPWFCVCKILRACVCYLCKLEADCFWHLRMRWIFATQNRACFSCHHIPICSHHSSQKYGLKSCHCHLGIACGCTWPHNNCLRKWQDGASQNEKKFLLKQGQIHAGVSSVSCCCWCVNVERWWLRRWPTARAIKIIVVVTARTEWTQGDIVYLVVWLQILERIEQKAVDETFGVLWLKFGLCEWKHILPIWNTLNLLSSFLSNINPIKSSLLRATTYNDILLIKACNFCHHLL